MMDELSAWRFLASYRYSRSALSFIEFIDNENEKVMTAPMLDDEGRLCSFIARAPTFSECAIQLSEMIQCDGRQQGSGSSMALESVFATNVDSGPNLDECGKPEVAFADERASAQTVIDYGKDAPATGGERPDCLTSEELRES